MAKNEKILQATLQKSYYGKARYRFENGCYILKSYNTDVLAIDVENGCFYRLWCGWSHTTQKHINDFLMLFGFSKIDKKTWLSIPCENDTPVFQVTFSNGFVSHTGTAILTRQECEKEVEKLQENRPFCCAWYD